MTTPDDEERDAVEDTGYDWDEDDFDDPLDWGFENEDEDIEYLDYTERYAWGDE